ncbi:MAG: hypothetical protein J7K84_00815 [Deltaproteobacteria bacterium]|nr:hypothetical protein [Deltaproteobacteria bacterium]
MKQKFKIINLLIIFFIAMSWVGCAFNIRTPIVTNYNEFEMITPGSDVEKLLGQLGLPQGTGTHLYYGNTFDVLYYHGFEGRFSSSRGSFDVLGHGFFSFKDGKAVQSIFWNSNPDVEAILLNEKKPIDKLSALLSKKTLSVSEIVNLLGPAPYLGKMYTPTAREQRSMLFYDYSKAGKNDTVVEDILLIGYDSLSRVTDVLWQSSNPEEVAKIGHIGFSYIGLRGDKKIEMGNNIEPAKVEPLLLTNPKNISEIELELGFPTSRGYKKFMNEERLLLSSWAHQKMEILDKQPGYSNPQKNYFTIKLDVSRLMVIYRDDGSIVETMWFRPILPGEQPLY